MGTIRATGKHHKLYIKFQFMGQREEPTRFYCSGSQKKKCSCAGHKGARRLLALVERDKRNGLLTETYCEHFPNSRFLKKLGPEKADERTSFSGYASLWLDMTKCALTHSTVSGYRSSIRSLADHFGNADIKSIRPVEIQSYINSQLQNGMAPKTVKNRIGCLSSIMQWAYVNDMISDNPCRKVRLPRVASKKVEPFTVAEIQAILHWMDEHKSHMTVFFALGFFTGMRTGEIMGLKWEDIDLGSNKIRVCRSITNGHIREGTKTAPERRIDIITVLFPYLTMHRTRAFDGASSYAIVTKDGAPFNNHGTISETYWKPCLVDLGINYRQMYQMRHTFACIMIQAGESMTWVRDMLGHRTLEMILKRYGNQFEHKVSGGGSKFNKYFDHAPIL